VNTKKIIKSTFLLTIFLLILSFSVIATNTTNDEYKKKGLERALENDLGLNARIVLEDLYYHRMDRVSERIRQEYPSNIKGVISNNRFDTEILLKNTDNSLDLQDFIVKSNYVSAKNYKEPVIIRFYTGTHGVSYNILKHNDYGVSEDVILSDGYEFMNVVSVDGYIEFESVNGFSTFIFTFPTQYISSSLTSEFGYFYVSDYTNKKVKQLVIPNFDTEQSQLVNAITGSGFTSGDLTLIDGIEYVAVNDVSDDVYVYYKIDMTGLNYRKDIFVIFDDWTKAKVTIDTSDVQPTKYFDLPNLEMGYNEEYNFYIPFYVLKSNVLKNGYDTLGSTVFFTERGTDDLISGSVIILDEFGSGSTSTTWFDAYVVGHTNVRIISKTTDKNFDLRVVPRNIYLNTQPLISEINIADNTFVPEEPEIITNTVASIEDNSVILRGRLDAVGSDEVDLSFEYREQGSSTWKKTVSSGTVTKVTNFVSFVDNLKSNTIYEYRARIDYDNKVKRGSTLTFTTLSPITSGLPEQTSSLPIITLDTLYTINDLSSYFNNFDYIDVVIPNYDTELNVLMYKPISGSAEYNFDYLDLKYFSDYKLEIRESVKNNFYIELTLVVGNENGIITRNILITVGDPEFVPSEINLTAGLVSYWAFDETSGTTATDSHGNNDGTISGATIDQIGKINKAYYFDGVDDYVTTGVGPSSSFTWSAWVDFETSTIGHRGIFTTLTAGTGRDGLTLVDNNDGKLYLIGYSGNSFLGQIVSDSYSSGFVHVVVVWDGSSDTGTIYLDGVSSVSGIISGVSVLENDFVLGRKYATTGTEFFEGSMDEVGIWSRALSSVEVSALYNSGSGLSYNDIVGEIDELSKISDVSNFQMEQWSQETITISDYFSNVYDYVISFNGDFIGVNEQYNTDNMKITTTNTEILFESKAELGTHPIIITTFDVYTNTESTSFNIEIVSEITDPLPNIIHTLTNIIIPYESENTRILSNYLSNYDELIIYISDITNMINYAPLNSLIGGSITETTYQIILDEVHDTLKFVSESTDTEFTVQIYAQNEYGTIEANYDVTIGDLPTQNVDLEEFNAYNPNSVFNLHSFDLQSIVLDDYFNNIDEFWVLNEKGNKMIDSNDNYFGRLPLTRNILGQNISSSLGLFRIYKDPSLNNVIIETYGNTYSNDLTGYNNDFLPHTPKFGFDVITSTESFTLDYPISILSINGLNRINYLNDILIDGEGRSEGDTYIIDVKNYYSNYDEDVEGNIIGNVVFFKEYLTIESLINTSLDLYTVNSGDGISLSDFEEITHPDYNYIYQDEYFIITINTITGIITLVDKNTFNLSIETEGLTAFRRFSYQVGMIRSDPISNLTDEYFVVMDDVYDVGFFTTFPYEEPLPPVDEGLTGFFSSLFSNIYPDSTELTNNQKMSRVFITILFILLSLIILNYSTDGTQKNLLVGLGVGLSVFMIVVFTLTGYIPIWIIIVLVLSLIGFGVGKIRNNLVGNNAGG